MKALNKKQRKHSGKTRRAEKEQKLEGKRKAGWRSFWSRFCAM